MTNPLVSRRPAAAPLRARLLLASWPLALMGGCTVYDDVLLAAGGGTSAAGDGSVAMSGAGAGAGLGGSDSAGGGGEPGGTGGATIAGSGGSDAGGGNGSGAGSGGGTSLSGSGGGGGEPAASLLIDDMEDTDAQINQEGLRNGYWYVGNDETVGGMQEPESTATFVMFELAAGERDPSTHAAHMKVSGFTGWGSVIGFNLREQLGAVQAYDASAACGIQFWGRAAAATSLRLRLPDGDTHPAGGVCSTTGPADQLCYDHFSAPVALTTTWKEFKIAFAALEQVGSGYHPPDGKFKPDQLFAAEWAIPGGGGKAFEIWLDDVAFVACE